MICTLSPGGDFKEIGLDNRIHIKMGAGFALVVSLMIVLVSLNLWFFNAFYTHFQWVAHTHEVRAQIEAMKAGVIESESARRGYVVTGEDVRLGEFQQARTDALSHLKQLRELTTDNSTQQAQLNLLEPLIRAHLEFSDRVIHLRQTEGFDKARMLTLTNEGVRLIVQIKILIQQMNGEESRLLIERTARVWASFKSLTIVSALLLGVTLILLIAMAVVIWRYIHLITHAYEQMGGAYREAQKQLKKWQATSGESYREGVEVVRKFMAHFVEAQEILKGNGNGKTNGAKI